MALMIWYLIGDSEWGLLVVLVGIHSIIRVAENYLPAHQDWQQSGSEVLSIVAVTVFGLIFYGVVESIYLAFLVEPLAAFRQNFNLNFWPQAWPTLVQLILLVLCSEFIFYWMHRSFHRWSFLWRLSGHGFHHSYQNLHAINFLTAHPLEIIFLAFPTLFLAVFFGIDKNVVVGAAILLSANTAVAHSNLNLYHKGIAWLFTTSNHHQRHHSCVFAESNTNYSCNLIMWDRLFGTFSEGPTRQTGIGQREPSLWQKFMLPIRQPDDTQTSPK